MNLKKKFLFLGKKEQIFKIASQSCATPMPLHTQNLKIWFFSSKNENLSDLLKFSTCFDLLWLLWLQTEANWSDYKIFLKPSFSPKSINFLVHHIEKYFQTCHFYFQKWPFNSTKYPLILKKIFFFWILKVLLLL